MNDSPSTAGLYDPFFEHDACGVGAVIDLKGRKSSELVGQSRTVLNNLAHRGACGCEENTGDGKVKRMELAELVRLEMSTK